MHEGASGSPRLSVTETKCMKVLKARVSNSRRGSCCAVTQRYSDVYSLMSRGLQSVQYVALPFPPFSLPSYCHVIRNGITRQHWIM